MRLQGTELWHSPDTLLNFGQFFTGACLTDLFYTPVAPLGLL